MREDIQNIIENVVSSIDKTITVTRIEDGAVATSKLFVCDLKWLEVGQTIMDDQNRTALITSVGSNFVTIVKNPNYVWDSKVFTIIKDIYFFRGTPLAVDAEWVQYARIEEQKTPFVWLVGETQEKFFAKNQSLERESELRIFFLDIIDIRKNTTKQIHDNRLKYLNLWVDAFFQVIAKDSIFGLFDSWDSKNISRFGIETPQGYEKLIIDSNLCAVEVKFTLPIYKDEKCC